LSTQIAIVRVGEVDLTNAGTGLAVGRDTLPIAKRLELKTLRRVCRKRTRDDANEARGPDRGGKQAKHPAARVQQHEIAFLKRGWAHAFAHKRSKPVSRHAGFVKPGD